MEYFTILIKINVVIYLSLIAWRLDDIREELKKINKKSNQNSL